MKKIILLGDSIRMGYDKYVKDALAGVAEVYYPDDNCRFAQYLLRHMHQWKNEGRWPSDADIVHWNAGLWDIVELYGEEPLTIEEQYAEMVKRIDRQIKRLFPRARVVFATTTSVVESGFRPEFKRQNSYIERYNKIAVDALAESDCKINDLYSFSCALPDVCRSDATHFNTPEGRKALGDKVLSVLCAELEIDANEVDIESFVPEAYGEKKIGN